MRALPVLLFMLLAWVPAWAAEIKLATWNIAWLTTRPQADPAVPRDVARRSPADWRLLAGYAQRLAADVIAFQEVDGPEAAQRLFSPAEYTLVFAEEGDVQRTGFAIRRGIPFTRHPDLAALDLSPHARFSLRRGADVTVRIGDVPVRLLSIHLKAGCRDGAMEAGRGPDCEALGRQTQFLAEWTRARAREGANFAILGDFNRRMDRGQDDMLAALEAETPILRTTAGVSNPCWADGRGGRPFIDHILLGGGAQRLMQPESLRVLVYAERDPAFRERLSDHCPISVRLRAP